MGFVSRILAVAVLAQVIVAVPHERAAAKSSDSTHHVSTAGRELPHVRAPSNYFQRERNAVHNLLLERSPPHNKVMHERSPAHKKVTHERQVTQHQDEEAASIISRLVTQYHLYLLGPGMNSTRFVALMDFLTGLKLEDPASITPVMHDLLDSQYLREVILTLIRHEWMKNAVNTLYRYVSFMMEHHKVYSEAEVDYYNTCDYEWCEVRDRVISTLHFINTAEQIGLLSHDTDGTRTMHAVLGMDISWIPDFAENMEESLTNLVNFHSATTDEEEEQQCADLTQAIRKAWNDTVTEATQYYNPDANQTYPNYVFNWTGISMDNHQDFKDLICELISEMRLSGVGGLYTVLQNRDIFWKVISHGYPLVVDKVNRADQMVDDMLSQYTDLDIDAPTNLSDQVKAFELAKILIDILRHDMGLLDLNV